jgi:hypothetical protein
LAGAVAVNEIVWFAIGGFPTTPLGAATLYAGPPRSGLVHTSEPVGLYAYTKWLELFVTYTLPPDGLTAMLFGVTAVVKVLTTV